MFKRIKELGAFIKAVSTDERIPDRDKATLAVMVVLLASPFDLIPDWIPIIGVLDDFIVLALVLDYLFNRLDQEILLSHYPWGMKSFVRIRRVARVVALFTPSYIKNRIWQYQPSVYK